MKLNKKGFSMVELLAVVVILGILVGVGVPAVSKYLQKSRTQAYETMEKNAYTAAKNYLIDNNIDVDDVLTIDIKNDLVDIQYMDRLVDPVDNGEECTGEVDVIKNMEVVEGALNSYSYCVKVKCSTYETKSSGDKVKKDSDKKDYVCKGVLFKD